MDNKKSSYKYIFQTTNPLINSSNTKGIYKKVSKNIFRFKKIKNKIVFSKSFNVNGFLKKNQIRNTVFPILFLFLGAIGLVSPFSISMALFLLLKVRKNKQTCGVM